MARQEERHHLIPKLGIGHLAAVFVLGRQQAREEIVPVLAASPAALDDGINNRVEPGDGVSHLPIPGGWQPVGEDGEQAVHPRRQQLVRRLQGIADVIGPLAEIRAEECLAGNLRRQPHHLSVDVANLAGRPAVEHSLGTFDDHRGVRLPHPRPLKRGLHQPSLALPEIPLAEQQAVRHHGPDHSIGKRLDEGPAAAQHLLDRAWVVDEDSSSDAQA